MTVFPPETLAIILSQLKVYSSKGRFDARFPHIYGLDLHRCSLVHRSWTYESQTHLFRRVHVYWVNLRKFINVLEASPHLRNHIRALHVQFKEEQTVIDLNVSWYISGIDTYEGARPPTLPLKASGLKYVKTLKLSNVAIPSFESLLHTCPELQSLKILELNELPEPWDISAEEAAPATKAPPQRDLTAFSPVPITALQIEGAHLMWKHYPTVHKLFGESVETIALGFGTILQDTTPKVPHNDCTNCVFSGIQLARFSKLTRIEFFVGMHAKNWTDHIVTFGQELRQVDKPGLLQSINLKWGRTQDDYHRPTHVEEGCLVWKERNG
ncbi:hypothetical protein DL96DRAFT_1820499 [Flagelloscypha sp. PMI_526]|nr:hypothetical protein DL96DRAFT_1820499 [Flagelloscypha sp. PMI_526]